MSRHPIPYVFGDVPSTGFVTLAAAPAVVSVLNPDPPNEKFGFVVNYHVQVQVDGEVVGAAATLGLAGGSGDSVGVQVIEPGPFSILFMGSVNEPGDDGFNLFAYKQGVEAAQIKFNRGLFTAWPSGWFPWQ